MRVFAKQTKTPTARTRKARFTAVGVLCWNCRQKSRQLVGQSLSALCASSLEYVSAISSLHSLSEAVLLFSLTLFRLVSSEHRFAPPLD